MSSKPAEHVTPLNWPRHQREEKLSILGRISKQESNANASRSWKKGGRQDGGFRRGIERQEKDDFGEVRVSERRKPLRSVTGERWAALLEQGRICECKKKLDLRRRKMIQGEEIYIGGGGGRL